VAVLRLKSYAIRRPVPPRPAGSGEREPSARAWLNVQSPAFSKSAATLSSRPMVIASTVVTPPTRAVTVPEANSCRDAAVTVKPPAVTSGSMVNSEAS
jgi:hypothetical protein